VERDAIDLGAVQLGLDLGDAREDVAGQRADVVVQAGSLQEPLDLGVVAMRVMLVIVVMVVRVFVIVVLVIVFRMFMFVFVIVRVRVIVVLVIVLVRAGLLPGDWGDAPDLGSDSARSFGERE